ncbi:MAG: tRNA (adenosine(37)-N6)-threonylcarbamoyltransferase complex transferase subunit TsaD [Pseudomonadota bacterium]
MSGQAVTVLGIETSCDETAAAIVRLDGASVEILSDVVHSQTDEHVLYGGVVPEIAARAHAEMADYIVAKALEDARAGIDDLDGIAATSGPGLIGGVLVGMMTGKAMAMASGKPFLPINHLEGHALSPRLSDACPFPYLLLLVSGGHCQILDVQALGQYRRLGTTVDDAVGECFDKTAKLMGLGFPGGPAVEKLAGDGDPYAVDLPRPLLSKAGLNMSFAGLKTAVARAISAEPLTDARKADIAASFQTAVADVLSEKVRRALNEFDTPANGKRLVVAGGVAANICIRTALSEVADQSGADMIAPPLRHCTDNAAMIALAGAERLQAGASGDLTTKARPRWPLDEVSAETNPAYGHGRRGVKA